MTPYGDAKLVYAMACLSVGTKPVAKPIDGLTPERFEKKKNFLKPVLVIDG